ncbi:MAG: metallopeptidase TldD-related protein [Candidatus Methylumidiphilus sp.]
MSIIESTRKHIEQVSEAAFSSLKQGEELNLDFYVEDQTYIRFNRALVRQATAVAQRNLGLTFQGEGRKIRFTIDLTGQLAHDLARINALLERGRAEMRALPEDPFWVPFGNTGFSENHYAGDYPSATDWVGQIIGIADGLDFAGLLAFGPQISAVRNSAGLAHWFSSDSFFVDYSLYTVNEAGENKAVKGLYSDHVWQPEAFQHTMTEGGKQLEVLRQKAQTVTPGDYRVYLSPAAMEKLIDMFSWGAVSYDAWKKGQSGLQKLIEGKAGLSEKFSLKENFRLGLSPQFNSQGELAPLELPIFQQGQLKNLLVSSRSAKEYGIPSNGADSIGWLGEGLRSPEVATGDLDEADALKRLGKGLYLGNLHYLNWSDQQSARITGMTCYACFWVENGVIQAPIRDLRFDESLYRIFGSGLVALTSESRLFPSIDTYERRSLGGCKVPGALVESFKFTL